MDPPARRFPTRLVRGVDHPPRDPSRFELVGQPFFLVPAFEHLLVALCLGELCFDLGERGVHIARRTVTKYRKALGIESSTRRKQF